VTDALDIWAGVECTVRRVADTWDDQLARSGHAHRLDDLDRLAALGVSRIRYPVLWERAASVGDGLYDWRWSDARLDRLRTLALPPIVGLLHHGSGPRYTSLVDPTFPSRFARYASAVATRYPWVDAYTPINEPLTTARFSALYGHWYPHAHDDRSFVHVLLNQLRAIALAMRAIRLVRPDATLVQTEDLGATHATEPLAGQAEFENHRRWLTVDLQAGRVNPTHPLWSYLVRSGADPRAIEQCYCPPGIVGINHYPTSERFLDHRVERYPSGTIGGNGRLCYADVEALRAEDCVPVGIASLLDAAWQRYHIPTVITEAHIGCTREHQLRWLAEVCRAANSCRAAGADVRAVTVWSAFGAFDWASLLTRQDGAYEPGLFDVRSPVPRPTALATMTRALALGGAYDHPVLDVGGWWTRGASVRRPRVLAIVGANCLVGRELARACKARGLAYRTVAAASLDRVQPWAIVDTGSQEPHALALARRRLRIPLMTLSSAHVFDGLAGRPYVESDLPMAIGREPERERAILDGAPDACIVRTGPLFTALSDLVLDDDASVSPTYVPDLVTTMLDLLVDGASGVWHLANLVAPGQPARDRSYVLVSERATLMPSLADAMGRCTPEVRPPLLLEEEEYV
jgi:dTDP-4-dehydrorhamnose reductase